MRRTVIVAAGVTLVATLVTGCSSSGGSGSALRAAVAGQARGAVPAAAPSEKADAGGYGADSAQSATGAGGG